ncbi:Uncharacterised protein [Trueperella bialowiezensis]|uniref:ATP-dependent transcriptional regulator n=2 Tax=Trueperella bialowiezensis TaxID=312285 RepID=A0A3S4Z684_9ACTO|nr:Uncharacterised protein [Trueperella bialowiezensis]
MREKLEFLPHSPAFYERSLLIADAHGAHPSPGRKWRSLSAPVISTDLGVRKFDELSIFYVEHCRISGIDPVSDDKIAEWICFSGKSFGICADAALTFFGSYEAVSLASEMCWEELLKSGDYDDFIVAGTVLAAIGSEKSRECFELAQDRTRDPSERYLAAHRLAAAEIKRFSRVEHGSVILNSSFESTHLTQSGSPLETALKLNLEALTVQKSGALKSAFQLLERASTIIEDALARRILNDVESSMAVRYSSQIAINVAQLHVTDGDYTQAVAVLESNCARIAKRSPEYLPEAYSELSCGLYYAGRHREAINIANQAFGRLFHIGALKSMVALREIVAASYYKLDQHDEADVVARLIDTDPLGFQSFGGTR